MPALAILLCCFCLWSPISAIADEFGIAVKRAEMTYQLDSYVLSAEISYELSLSARDALQNGVPLYWIIQVKIQQYRDLLWNKTLIDKTIRYKIQYHALLNMYRVRNESTGEVANFSTLAAALDLMSIVHDSYALDHVTLASNKRYIAAIQVKLDRDSLPLPLRPIAFVSPQWYLSSGWYVWSLTN